MVPDTEYINRFERKVEFTDDCWEWLGWLDRYGYGGFWFRDRNDVAHRAAYELLVEPIPAGMEIDHLCRNRSCVNPDHLEVVTHGVNTLRGNSASAVNARRTHCPNGHEYTAENTYTSPQGKRRCRTCLRKSVRVYRERHGRRTAAVSAAPEGGDDA